ncbi:MAG TPA: methionyl-tRNA synthetase [Roseomonas sp.]|nr:methionyl-tRNA synthetase [Roseomonas sp.]
MTGTAPFFVNHTIRLSRTEVLEALRGAALARAREALRLVEPASRGVELETRLLSGSMVEIDGAAIVIEGRLPEDLAALLRTAPAASAVTPLEVTEAEPAEEPLVAA